MIATHELELIRDYERQLADMRLRISELERKLGEVNSTLNAMYAAPDIMLRKLQVAGFPAIDVKEIYETLDEWHREGGSDGLIEWLRQ